MPLARAAAITTPPAARGTLTVITPTCNRPLGMALLARWLTRQTRLPDHWIIANGGGSLTLPEDLPFAVEVLTRASGDQRPPGTQNFCDNLRRAIAAVPPSTDLLVICEDDDWLAASHLATLERQLAAPAARIAGDPKQRYYNLPRACFRLMDNHGSSLCQTGMRADLIPVLDATVQAAQAANHYAVDTALWTHIPRAQWALAPTSTVVGIKGLPGQVGLGLGHRPSPNSWTPDASRRQLAAWVGVDAVDYLNLGAIPQPA